jgi:hypothetical protein
MTSDIDYSTRAMASLVSEIAPARLDELKRRFPQNPELFEVVFVMGKKPSKADLEVHKALAIKALIEETVRVLDPTINKVQLALTGRIHRARTARLAGSIVATICSAGAVTGIAVAGFSITPVVSIAALAGSLFMLLGEHWEKPVLGGAKSLSELLGSTIAAEPVVQEIKLRLLSEDLGQPKALLEIAKKLNEISANMKYASLFGGVSLA